MKNATSRSILMFSLILSMVSFAVAQSNTGSIDGTVVDQNGAVIPNAKIKATLRTTNSNKLQLSTASNDSGSFSFSSLPFGIYDLELRVEWAEITFKKRVEVNSDKALQTNVIFSLEACSGEEEIGVTNAITEKDKAEIVRQMLKLFLEKHSNLLMEEQLSSKIILSTDNINPLWLSAEQKSKFNLMKQSDIQRRADETKDFVYLSFSKLNFKGNCVAVSLDNGWAVGENSGMGYLSGGGHTYEFRKIDGRWVGKHVIGWIS